ncbi:exported hypothetical protein [Syntrophobacter sp. SbD1]|nr:exported hypothetical protein [Syntrophobacter sp. SbD1]
MKMRRKFCAVILALSLVLASAYIAAAQDKGSTDRQTAQSADRGASGDDRDVNSSGAMRVDRDLYPSHYDDVNQFGDDEAYNKTTGHSVVRYPFHRIDP